MEGGDKNLEKRMHKELVAAKEAGGDVDRLVMERLLAGVRDSGPNTAYKALASIEVLAYACALCVWLSACVRVVCVVVRVGVGVGERARVEVGVCVCV